MVLGIGVDIVSIEDFKARAERNPRFIARIFGKEEINYCQMQKDPWPHFAARFAAKEAVMKAIGTGWAKGVSFLDIIISKKNSGALTINLVGTAKKIVEKKNCSIFISISFSDTHACGFAVLEKADVI